MNYKVKVPYMLLATAYSGDLLIYLEISLPNTQKKPNPPGQGLGRSRQTSYTHPYRALEDTG